MFNETTSMDNNIIIIYIWLIILPSLSCGYIQTTTPACFTTAEMCAKIEKRGRYTHDIEASNTHLLHAENKKPPAYRIHITPRAWRVSIRSCCCWTVAGWRARKRTDHRKKRQKFEFSPKAWDKNNTSATEGRGKG